MGKSSSVHRLYANNFDPLRREHIDDAICFDIMIYERPCVR
jgi:hypothetical protein